MCGTYSIDADYCYTRRTWRGRRVCLSVEHTGQPCKTHELIETLSADADWRRLKEPCIGREATGATW